MELAIRAEELWGRRDRGSWVPKSVEGDNKKSGSSGIGAEKGAKEGEEGKEEDPSNSYSGC